MTALVIAMSACQATVLRAQGVSFGPPATYQVGTAPTAIASADFNKDGTPDVVTADYGPWGHLGAGLSVLLGNGDGTLAPRAQYSFSFTVTPRAVETGDFNGDGKPDFVAADFDASHVGVFLGNGAGGFTRTEFPGRQFGALFIATGDLNGDGRTDFAVAHHFHGVGIYLNSTATGASTAAFSFSSVSSGGGDTGTVGIGDVNGDGKRDLLITTSTNVTVRLGNGNGTFATPYQVLPFSATSMLHDLNADGKLDIVANGSAGVEVRIGNGNGSFGSPASVTIAVPSSRPIVADLDADGSLDVAIGLASGYVAVARGNGNGTFAAAVSFPAGGAVNAMTARDFNGDNRLDLAAAGPGNTVSVLLNTTAPPDAPPVANAGPDQSVKEQHAVTLDGGQSSDPDGDALAYAWVQIGGADVALFDATTQQPAFTAPLVALGGETLTFELTVTAAGETHTDTVNVTVVNVNHTPVADAGDDASIAEGSPVTLDGTASFDVDGDPITYVWVQESGPEVDVTGAGTATLRFTAPFADGGGAPGVVATLVFRLAVDDGFPQDAAAAGYSFASVEDTVTILVTNVNNDPAADAAGDQTVNENAAVTLNGTASSDPDSDTLTYAWVQVGGAAVALSDAATATPGLTTPFVSPGGTNLTFQVTVNDGYGGTAMDTVVVHVQNANDPPLVSAAQPTLACLWPPNHALAAVGITGVSDPNDNATIVIDRVTQDEPTNGLGDGDTAVDAIINGDGGVLLRAERSGSGNGRVYHIHFTASDLEGSAAGVVSVCVPPDRKSIAIDGGELFDSTN